MDLQRFNDFTRALSNGNSRRDTLALLGSLLAFPFAALPAEAKKKKKKKITVCFNNQSIKVLKKKRDQFLLSGATLGGCQSSPPPPGSPPPPPPDPTCTDGVKNGDESGVDCGGSCPPCPDGQPCATREDCSGALCLDGTCTECVSDEHCGSDGAGECLCASTGFQKPSTCASQSDPGSSCVSSAECDSGQQCVFIGGPICLHPCGVV